jgi:CDP-diglyceride synthetase
MRLLFRSHFSTPIDINKSFLDGKPVFGHTKTFRGILTSLLFTSLMAIAIDIPVSLGAVVSVYAMLGDLISSFIKRRLDIPSSRSAPLLDQLPESSLPLLAVRSHFDLAWEEVTIILIVFFITDLILSYLLAKFYENTGSK